MLLDIARVDERHAIDRLTHEAWGQRLTEEEFAKREVRLRSQRWAREAMTTWVLRGEGGRPVASCETLRMESFLEDPARPGVRSLGSTYAVASVFVPPELRGRGYATEMMKHLVERLRREDPAAHASILYSDVGEELYRRAGYVARPAWDRVFEPDDGRPAQGVFRLLTESKLEQAFAKMYLPQDRFVVWPTFAQLDWHLERERIYRELLERPKPRFRGAIAGMSTIVWTADWKNDRLNVLLIEALTARDTEALLLCARRVANELELREVRMWDFPLGFELPDDAAGGRRVPREGAVPMICPLTEGLRPEDWNTILLAEWV